MLKSLVPFCVLVIGAFVGLAQFRKLNYQYKRNDQSILFKESLKQAGMSEDDYQYRTTGGIQEEYEKLMKKVDVDNWENIRGPRPGENSKEMQEQQRQEKLKKQSEN